MNSRLLVFICLLSNFSFSCTQDNRVMEEDQDDAFIQGRSFLKVGKEEEALDQFLSVTRRTIKCPKSHLEVGRLYLTLETRKDPVAAIYHFRRFLLLENESREAPKVEQLIVTAEREIIRNLPGEPYSDLLDSLTLKEENDNLKRKVADLQARIGLPLEIKNLPVPRMRKPQFISPLTSVQKPIPPQSTLPRTYVVKKGDSLYAISRKLYGDSSHIERIFQANRQSLSSKDSLKLGQTLIIPALHRNP